MLLYGAVMQTLQKLTRQCRACGHRQVVAARLSDATVRCAVCRNSIPPKR